MCRVELVTQSPGEGTELRMHMVVASKITSGAENSVY